MPPPRFLESLFRFLLPPAAREHVLGDLHERCTSSKQYLKDGLSVLAPVILSRIRRTTDFQVLFMETLSVYVSFAFAPWVLGQKTFLYHHDGLARLAVPAVVTTAGLLLCNAYSDPQKQRWPIKPLLDSACSLSLAFVGQMLIFDTNPRLGLPFAITVCGSCIGLVVLSTLRMLFPPTDFSNWKKQ